MPQNCKEVIDEMVNSSDFTNKDEVTKFLEDLAALSIPKSTRRTEPSADYVGFVKLFIPRTTLIDSKMACIVFEFGSKFNKHKKEADAKVLRLEGTKEQKDEAEAEIRHEQLDGMTEDLYIFLKKVHVNTEPEIAGLLD